MAEKRKIRIVETLDAFRAEGHVRIVELDVHVSAVVVDDHALVVVRFERVVEHISRRVQVLGPPQIRSIISVFSLEEMCLVLICVHPFCALA